MSKVSYIVRVIALAILSGGSSAIVFAAITLVKAAVAQGMPVAQAASQNEPVFFHYTSVALGAAILLAIAEALAVLNKGSRSFSFDRATKLRLASSGLAVLFTGILAFAIIPPMKQLLPEVAGSEAAHAQFKKLHEGSRGVFGAIILFAFVSLILPAFETAASNKS